MKKSINNKSKNSSRKGNGSRFSKGQKNEFKSSGSNNCKTDTIKTDVTEYTNDVAWYSKNQQLLFDAANIPFHYPVGSPISMDFRNTDARPVANYYTPGLTVMRWVPSIGISTDNNSAVNIAARNIYAFIRQANSGAKNYDSPDLMLYLLAMDSLHAYYSWMVRVYGTFQYTWVNQRYSPKQLVEAQGANYDDIIGKLAQFRYYINSFAVRLSALAVPNDMYYFTRHRWMSSNIYMDQPSTKAQFYMYVPKGLYKYGLNPETGAGMLNYKGLGSGKTLDSIMSYGEDLLNAVLGDEDINIMSGDILKAYGSNLVVLPRISDDYKVEPVYSGEVLEQIHNAVSVPDILHPDLTTAKDNWNIAQDPTNGALLFFPYANFDANNEAEINRWGKYAFTPNFALLDSMYDIPTASDTMIATRLSTICTTDENTQGGKPSMLSIYTAGSEIITGIYAYVFSNGVYSLDPESTLIPITWKSFDFMDFSAETTSVSNVTAPMMFYPVYDSGAFDRMPLRLNLFRFKASESQAATLTPMILGERNNLTLVDREDLKRMHDCALLSEFNVPAFGPGK